MKVDFRPAETFRGTTILREATNLAYAYETSSATADADGAPNAYSPADIGKDCLHAVHVGLDCLSNAGYPNTDWWDEVLVPDSDNPQTAYIQASGPFKGFFVSMTSLRSLHGNKFDPATYVDATKVPYVVIPTGFSALPHVAGQGDVGFATHLASGRTTAFIVGDAGGGTDAKLGEASIALFAALGFPNANPRNGEGLPRDAIQYVFFPGSRQAGAAIWPRNNEDIAAQVAQLLESTPGIEADA